MFYSLYRDMPRSDEKEKTFCRSLAWKTGASFHKRKWESFIPKLSECCACISWIVPEADGRLSGPSRVDASVRPFLCQVWNVNGNNLSICGVRSFFSSSFLLLDLFAFVFGVLTWSRTKRFFLAVWGALFAFVLNEIRLKIDVFDWPETIFDEFKLVRSSPMTDGTPDYNWIEKIALQSSLSIKKIFGYSVAATTKTAFVVSRCSCREQPSNMISSINNRFHTWAQPGAFNKIISVIITVAFINFYRKLLWKLPWTLSKLLLKSIKRAHVIASLLESTHSIK